MWLEYHDFKDQVKDADPVILTFEEGNIIAAWNMMRCEIIWQSLDAIAEYLEVRDIELFIDGLLVLQEHQRVNK